MGELRSDLVVWQSNWLVEASQQMTLNEKRLVLAAAALHDPRKPLPPSATVKLHVMDFADVFGLQPKHVYEALEEAAKRLFNRRIREIKEGKRGRVIRDTRWVWMAEYNEGEGTVTLGFSPTVVPYLTLLHQQFTRLKLRAIGSLGSFYGIRLYELFAQYLTIGERTIELTRLREMLGLNDKYSDVKNLRVRVLDPAVDEINKHTDLRVTMTPIRRGRTVTGFHFFIRIDAQMNLDFPIADPLAALPGGP